MLAYSNTLTLLVVLYARFCSLCFIYVHAM